MDGDPAPERPDRRTGSLGAGFWRLWCSSGLSNLADGIVQVALPLLAVQLTRSPTLIAGLTVALTVPWLVFALPAGALADRLDRRRAMLGANSVRSVLLAGLTVAVVTDTASIWLLYVIAFGIGVCETMYDTSAQSIVPQLVGRELLSRANGRLFAAELTANQFVGPPLAGLLVAAGAVGAFATPAALWLTAVGALLVVRGRFRAERPEAGTLRRDIAEGLRFLWRHRLLRTMAMMVGTFNFASNATFTVLVLYAIGPGSAMGLTDAGYGVLLVTVAVGSLLGSLLAERLERALGRARALGVCWAAGTLAVGAPALSSRPPLVGALFVVGGFGLVVANVISVSFRQRVTPDHLLGRMNSGFRLVAWGTRPLGAMAGGLLAEWWGLRPVFAVMGALALASTAGMTIVTGRRMHEAERGVDDAVQ